VLLVARPLRDDLAALLDAHAVAEVVAEDDVEARQDDARQELVQRAERLRVDEEAVVDVAEEEELAGRVALVERAEAGGPGGRVIVSEGHSLIGVGCAAFWSPNVGRVRLF
jgi:hypothetical protein